MDSRFDDRPEDTAALNDVLDRMLKAGWIQKHGHSETVMGIAWTPAGIERMHQIQRIERALGGMPASRLEFLWAIAHTMAPLLPEPGKD